MATKSIDLEDQTSGADLQIEGQTPMPSRAERTLKRHECWQCPLPLTSWSLARKLSPGHPNTRHCLGIHVTLTEETGATLPPPHAWMVPLVEDMLCYGRTGLTKAVVTGLGRAVLFYGRWSTRDSLSTQGERCHIYTYRSRHLVGKPAYHATDPLTIQEAWQMIAQAVTECQIEVRGPGQPQEILPKKTSLQMPVLTINHCPAGHREAGITIDVEGTRGWYHFNHLTFPRLQIWEW